MRNTTKAYIVFIIILLASLITMTFFRKQLFSRKQESKKKSLDSGYGFYSDPQKLPCNSADGKCTSASTEKIIMKCIPNPHTGKGCIDDDGFMTYNTKILERPCQMQCIGSNFTVQNGITFNNVNTPKGLYIVPTGSGCNNIIKTSNGINYTDYFLGDYDPYKGDYPLKNCIPDTFQGYYQRILTCNPKDPQGPNNCKFTCGEYRNILRLKGLFNAKTSKEVLNFYPIEYNEEGHIRHVCYDINDVNQIEILNSVNTPPNDFFYPDICYKHFNQNKVNPANLNPVGNSNVNIVSNYNYLEQANFFYFPKYQEFKQGVPDVINYNYDITYDYENYIKLNINNEIMLLEKIIETSNISNQNLNYKEINQNIFQNSEKIIAYISFDKPLTSPIKNYRKNDNTFSPLTQYVNAQEILYNNNTYVAVELNDILTTSVGTSSYVYYDQVSNTSFIDKTILSIGEYIYYYTSEDYYNSTGRLNEILSIGSSAGVNGNIIANYANDYINYYTVDAKITNKQIEIQFVDNTTASVNIEDIIIPGNIFLSHIGIHNKFNVNSNYNICRSQESMLSFYTNSSFYLFGTGETGLGTGNTGFFYPLYLTDATDRHAHTFTEYPDYTFYMSDDQKNHGVDTPPSRDKNYLNFSDFYSSNVITTQIGKTKDETFFPRQINLTTGGYYPNFDSSGTIGEKKYLTVKDNDGRTGFYVPPNMYTEPDTAYLKTLRNNNKLTSNYSSYTGTIEFGKKMRVYNDMINTQNRNFSTNGSSISVIVNPEKKVFLEADFRIFKSPYVENSDGTINSVCFDDYGRPKPAATLIVIPSSSRDGDKNNRIVANISCSNFNTNPTEFTCGKYGLSSGIPCQQKRNENLLAFSEEGLSFNAYNEYKNYNNFLEPIINITNNELYCLDDYNKPYNKDSEKKCFPTFYTSQKEIDRVYASQEELFINKVKRDYYLSLINDNTFSPLRPVKWKRIFNYEPGINAASYESFFLNRHKTNFVFSIDKGGVIGIEPDRLAVNYVFSKFNSIFLPESEDMHTGILSNDFPWTKYYQINTKAELYEQQYKFFDITYNLLTTNIASIPAKDIYDQTPIVCQIGVSFTDNTIGYSDYKIGDIFNPDLSFFNNLLFSTVNLQNNLFETTLDTDFFTSFLQKTINVTILPLSSPIVEGGYFILFYTDSNLTFLENLDTTNNFNQTFEIMLIKSIVKNTSGKITSITVERNILNLTPANYFYGTNSIKYYGGLINKDFINLNFPITQISNNTLQFNMTITVPRIDLTKTVGQKDLITKFDTSDFDFLTKAFSARIIRKNVTTPQVNIANNNLNFYLANAPQENKVISILSDWLAVPVGKSCIVYINEFFNDRYNSPTPNTKDGIFNIGDVISLNQLGKSKLELTITDKNVFYNGIKKFDYLCSMASVPTITPSNIKYLLRYAYGQQYGYQNITNISQTPNPELGINNMIVQTQNPTQPTPQTQTVHRTSVLFDIYPLLGPFTVNLDNIPINTLIQDQVNLDKFDNSLYTLTLKTTTASSSDNINVKISNIKISGKPEGPSYLTNIATSNILDKKGYGIITDFDLSDDGQISSLQNNTEFITPAGFIFRTTNLPVSSYTFESAKRDILVTQYVDNTTYSSNDIVEYTNPNQRLYFQNITNTDAIFDEFGTSWRPQADSFYDNVSNVTTFKVQNSYFKGDIVSYFSKLWKAQIDNFSQIPSLTSSKYWKEYTFTNNDLINNKGDFFNITSDGATINSQELTNFIELNDQNLPLCINDYKNNINYCPNAQIFDKKQDYSKSFVTKIAGISGFDQLFSRAFITKTGVSEYLSLASVPTTSDNILSNKFLGDTGDPPSEDTLSQYIYQLPILNPDEMGKPYCTGNYSTYDIEKIVFSNSIMNTIIPLGLEYQDFPSFGVSDNGNKLLKYTYNGRNLTSMDMKLINEGVSVSVTTGVSITSITEQSVNNNVLSKYTLDAYSDGAVGTIDLNITNKAYLPIPDDTVISNQGTCYKNGDLWYIIPHGSTEIASHGYITTNNSDGKLYTGSFNSYQPFNATGSFYSGGLTIISPTGKDFAANLENTKYQNLQIADFTLDNPSSDFAPGIFTNGGLSVRISGNGSGNIMQFNELLIGTSTPPGVLSQYDDTTIYQVLKDGQIKVKMYSLFGLNYLSNVSYQLDDKLLNDKNVSYPGLIFDIYNNDIFSTILPPMKLAIGTSFTTYDNYYNTFILQSNDGTSSDITLRCNYYDRPPSIEIDNKFLINAFSGASPSPLNIVNSNTLTNLNSQELSIKNNIYLDNINTFFLNLSDPTNNTIELAEIRQNINGQNINENNNCNIFFTNHGLETNFPFGGKFLFQKTSSSPIVIRYREDTEETPPPQLITTPITLRENISYIFDQSNTSNNDVPISFSTKSSSDFTSSILGNEENNFGNGEIILSYFLNEFEVTYDQYNNTDIYNNSIERGVNIVYRTDLAVNTPPATIYIGFNKTYYSSSINTVNLVANN